MTPPTSSTPGSSDVPSGVPPSVSGPVVDRMARSAHSAVDRVADTANSTAGRVRSGVTDALSTVSGQVQSLTSSREQWLDNCRQTLRDHPLVAVAVGLAAGCLIARWMRD